MAEDSKQITDGSKIEKRQLGLVSLAVLVVAMLVGGLLYWHYNSGRVQIDNSQISAPLIALAAGAGGTLQEVGVNVGDMVLPDTVVARVDNQIIKSKLGGLIVATLNDIGKRLAPNEAPVTMIDPRELRVVGQLEEDKGLPEVHVGQRAVFTVDAFGSRKFFGTVDNVSPTSHESGVVFNISDKRATHSFDVKVRFNIADYPELKNGMSAKITILKD